jgi:hypothetical protein
MIIHLIASKSGSEEENLYYQRIVDYVKSKGHSLAYDWVGQSKAKTEQDNISDWTMVDNDNAGGIARADVVIVEATKKSFFVGYGMAQAVQQKKPTLVMYRDDSFPGAKDLSKTASFIQAVEYNDSNLEKILGKFIEENTIDTKDMRFNFFIDRPIYNYLRWAAFKTGKTKAEILRNLVQREIDTKD